MGLFTREEKMNKETGKFEVTKKGLFNRESRTPEYDKLHAQAKAEKKDRKREYREAYQEAKHKAKLARMRQEGKRAGSISLSDRFSNITNNIKVKPYTTRNNYNPWGSMFDTGIKKPKKTNKPRKEYVVINNKAYPIINKKISKKKKKKKSSTGQYDLTDNWGFFK